MTHPRFALTLVLLFGLVPLYGGDCDKEFEVTPIAGPDDIKGTVTLDGAPLADVIVRVFGLSVTGLNQDDTDSEGVYFFRELPEGSLWEVSIFSGAPANAVCTPRLQNVTVPALDVDFECLTQGDGGMGGTGGSAGTGGMGGAGGNAGTGGTSGSAVEFCDRFENVCLYGETTYDDRADCLASFDSFDTARQECVTRAVGSAGQNTGDNRRLFCEQAAGNGLCA